MFFFVPSTWPKVPKDLAIPWVICNECFSIPPEFTLMRWLLLGFPLTLPPRQGTGCWRKRPCDDRVVSFIPTPWPSRRGEKGWSLISSWLTSYRPSLGLVNLLEWLTELRKTLYLGENSCSFIITGPVERRDAQGKVFPGGSPTLNLDKAALAAGTHTTALRAEKYCYLFTF